MPLALGSHLGPYEILAALGAGGMGEVYRARDTKLNRDVALKILPEAFTLDGDRIARFRREAQVLASLNHPNIAAIYGFEDSGSTHALVLELVEGPTLADRIAQGAIPLDEALTIARQIAEALEAAHEQGIIHRDLKPANIKVRDDGTVKVLDFGLAKLTEPAAASSGAAQLSQSPTITTPAMTGVGVILGTAAYMSPEQAKGRPADKRSDVWAFGCVLYEMLTGRKAFDGDDTSDVLASVLRSEPDWTSLPSGATLAVCTMIRRCLVKDRRQRIADVAVVRFVLAEVWSLSAPVPAGRDSDQTRTIARVEPFWRRVWPVAAAVVVTAAIVGGTPWTLRPAPVPPTVMRFSSTLPDTQQFPATSRQFIAISPDGTQLAYVANNRIFVRALSELQAHPVPGTEIAEPSAELGQLTNSPTFSPDGRSLAFYGGPVGGSGGGIKRVAVTGGVPVIVCETDGLYGMTWDPSGIVFAQNNRANRKGVFRCPSNGGEPEQLATVKPDEQAHGPQLLPGGQSLLFTISSLAAGMARWDQAQVVVQSLKSGQRKVLIKNGSDAQYVPTGHLVYALGGTMFAVPFDLARQEVTGGPTPVLQGVRRPVGANTGTAYFATSTGGTALYIPGPAGTAIMQREIATADRSGTVTRVALPAGPYVHVRASRDGTRLAMGTDDGKEAIVWIYNLAGTSAPSRRTFEGKNRFPIWSPDGQRIAFQSDREGDPAIFAQRADGTGPIERLTKPAPGESHVPESWSPDGRHLSFSVTKGATIALWMLSLDDKNASPYGNVQSSEPIESVFSPDGRWIAYTSTPLASVGVSPNRGVFLQPFPATGDRYQVPKQQIDFHPIWSRTGTELFFVPTTTSGRLAAVHVTTQPTVAFGTTESLPVRVTGGRLSLEKRAHDVLPDGRFIGLVTPGQDASLTTASVSELRVIVNWFEELKAQVPTK